MHYKHSMLDWPLRPGNYASIDRLIAESVAEDKQPVRDCECFMKAACWSA
jgi:hypothetical protein